MWGGAPGDRYAALFADGNLLAERYGMADPATWRPSLADLVDAGSCSDCLVAARELGYRLSELAAHLGVHESTVSRRLRKKGVRPRSCVTCRG
jgi:hypothetical protein